MAPHRPLQAEAPARRVHDRAVQGRAAGPDRGDLLHRLQRAAGNEAVTRLIASQARGRLVAAPGARPGALALPVPVVQRAVRLAGVPRTYADLVALPVVTAYVGTLAPADATRALLVVSTWSQSATVHDFGSVRRLVKAVRKALETAQVGPAPGALPPAPYLAANLMFVTQAGGRLPTLYFGAGGVTGRLRQQHPGGPLAQVPRANKVDYFSTRRERLQRVPGRGAAFRGTPREQRLRTVPQPGDFHLELTYDAAGHIAVRHMSEGTVARVGPDPVAYPQNEVTRIYKAAIGQP
ncbi:hypothetical protein [Cellulomonas sp.]|uniref:hypothetical protein n=1 Tax=Cellulomonas sp. TaxID=40001 RepID=UPI001B138580|nr:hypothetical protein [Cellulomonas sp.]MBO9555257.1 hypothetical protein [Cellulomonas sp.]